MIKLRDFLTIMGDNRRVVKVCDDTSIDADVIYEPIKAGELLPVVLKNDFDEHGDEQESQLLWVSSFYETSNIMTIFVFREAEKNEHVKFYDQYYATLVEEGRVSNLLRYVK